jgi:hypothetical protein
MNFVLALRVGTAWVEDVAGIREEAVNCLSTHFSEPNYHRTLMEGFEFKSLSIEDSGAMSVPFSLEEITEAVTGSDGNKRQSQMVLTSRSLKDFGG